MTFSDVTRFGQANRAGNTAANFARVVREEIIMEYENACLLKDKHTVVDGKGASYAARIGGQSQATIDTRLLGPTDATTTRQGADFMQFSTSPRGNVQIFCDLTYYDNKMLYNFDLDQSPESQEELANAIAISGSSVARLWDSVVMLAALKGAAADDGPALTPGGSTVSIKATDANAITSGALETSLPRLLAMFNEKNIPDMQGDDRMLAFNPTIHAVLASSDKWANSFLGGSGSLSEGQVPRILGFRVMSTNQIIAKNITGATKFSEAFDRQYGGRYDPAPKPEDLQNPTFSQFGQYANMSNDYTGDNSKVVGVAWHPSAVMTVFWSRAKSWTTLGSQDINNYIDAVALGTNQRSGTQPVYPGACGRIVFDPT